MSDNTTGWNKSKDIFEEKKNSKDIGTWSSNSNKAGSSKITKENSIIKPTIKNKGNKTILEEFCEQKVHNGKIIWKKEWQEIKEGSQANIPIEQFKKFLNWKIPVYNGLHGF